MKIRFKEKKKKKEKFRQERKLKGKTDILQANNNSEEDHRLSQQGNLIGYTYKLFVCFVVITWL